MHITKITRTLKLAGFAPAGKLSHLNGGFLPVLALLVATLGKLKCGKRTYAVLVLCAATAIALPAQTFTTPVGFDGADGNFATTEQTAPSLTTLYSFAGGTDGATPYNEALVLGKGGELYGTTQAGGSSNDGTVFALTPPAAPGGSWTEAILHVFQGSDGSLLQAGLAIGPSGELYGTAEEGTF